MTYVHLFLYNIALSLFLEELDRRVENYQKDLKKHVPERRAREVGECTGGTPPVNAPKWTIDTAWLQSKHACPND